MQTSFESILVERMGWYTHVTLNRPEARNALSPKAIDELTIILEFAHDDEETRALLITGAGDHFCAGADIKTVHHAREQLTQGNSQYMTEFTVRFGQLIHAIDRFSKPVVVGIKGSAFGGGFGLACAADITVLHNSAKMGLPETRLGLTPAQIAPFVLQRLGAGTTRRLALTGETIQADEAFRLGIGHYLEEDDDQFEERLCSVMADINQCAPGALLQTKEWLLNLRRPFPHDTIDAAAELFTACAASPEGEEGAMAFMQKRRPNWAQPN